MNAYQTLCNMLHDGKILNMNMCRPSRINGMKWEASMWSRIGLEWITGRGDTIDAAQCAALKAYRERFGDV